MTLSAVQTSPISRYSRPSWVKPGLMTSEVPLIGDLGETPARLVIDYLHRTKFSGTLSLRSRDKKKKLWFFLGEVFRVQSNLVPELIGRMMVDRNWINEADLRTCLRMQKELLESDHSSKRIGDLVSELHGVDGDEIESLLAQQGLNSFVQALTWNAGKFEVQSLSLKKAQKPILPYREVAQALQALFAVSPSHYGKFFDQIETWQPGEQSVELSRIPLWNVLAVCRRMSLSGILSVRRQNKFFEIVLKFGVPLTLYEGTFGQPRQTIVVRQASEEHEHFFIDQLFQLFSFFTGNVYFRSLGDRLDEENDSSNLQFRDETAVTKSVSSEDIPFEIDSELMNQKSWFGKFIYQAKRYLRFLSGRLSLVLERKYNALKEQLDQLQAKL